MIHSRWSKSARIWESRRRSWTPVCFILFPVTSRRPANAGVATTQSRRLPKENADQINKDGSQTDHRSNKRAMVAKWAVSEAAAARADGKKTKRVSKSDDVFDGGLRDVDERTRRDLDDFDDELY